MELLMSQKERDRIRVLEAMINGRLKQSEAAEVLHISTRQLRRIAKRYRTDGDQGLVHGLRGRQSNRKIGGEVKKTALKHLRQEYHDFGPTLASEKLFERQSICVSRETVRQWMMAEGLWKSRKKRIKHHSWRPRRSCFGELIQMDSSVHDWFEGRNDKAWLISLIDDASSRPYMRFFPTDSTETNMAAIKGYIKRHGRPVAIYADKASHFRTTRKASVEEELNGTPALTQIQRALKELGIEYISANSPQAKGRVERCFGTAQDRLVKEFRLNEISTIDQANEFLKKKFIPMWNRRFAVKPANSANLHRPRKGFDLDAILSRQQFRTVAKDYTISFDNQLFLIDRKHITAGLRGAKVVMEQRLDGSLHIRWKTTYLKYEPIEKPQKVTKENPGDALGLRPRTSPTKHKPGPHHPWRQDTARTFLFGRNEDISTLR
jgi:transposase/signal recognition particle subunit SEC65